MSRSGGAVLRIVLSCAFGLAVAVAGAQAQQDSPAAREARDLVAANASAMSEPTVLVGSVLGPDGLPAADAVVVTSAGGQAVTDAAGAFTLEIELPAGAESLQVTAVLGAGSGSLVGSAQVSGLVHWGTTSAGTVILEQSAGCQPSWLPTFGGGPEVNSYVFALTVFDDGNGPALYVGGDFTLAGNQPADRMAKWDGKTWSGLGSGVDGSVRALAVFDDGQGPALYAGGYFTTAGGVLANQIAKWGGSNWSALGTGIGDSYPQVAALTVFDDGSGPALYAGGSFTTAGGIPANNIAKWDGTNWSALGSGMNGSVAALAAFDDGSGSALYAGGNFKAPAIYIAKWNGTSWSALGSGTNNLVLALTVFDDGSGPALYAGGWFTMAGGVAANRIAKWNGTNWSALGSGIYDSVNALTVFDDGSGPALYAGGSFSTAGGVAASNIAKWDGSNWSPLGTGINGPATALTVFNDGSGPMLVAGGYIESDHIVKWDGVSWSQLSGTGLNDAVYALTVFDDGSGPALYASGFFTFAGGVAANKIAKWGGTSWSALGSGINGTPLALTVFDDGQGPALYAGGYFEYAGSVSANRIAKWDGTSWSALDSGVAVYCPDCDDPFIGALAAFDDGSGPALYAGGKFDIAGSVAASNIAKWDGTTWSALGSGVNNGVSALTVFDDGSNPALYVGGNFTDAGGVAANNIAKWNGSSWSALGSGMDSVVAALTVFDDGSGPALYAGGYFTTAGSVAASNIAKWGGSTWSALGSGVGTYDYESVYVLTVFDDGSGPALYAGGYFTTAGGVTANYIANWNGTSWSALGRGMNNQVNDLTVFDDGSGLALYAGGYFTSAGDSGDSYLAKWGCPAAVGPWINLGHALAGASGQPLLEGSGSLLPDTAADLLLTSASPGAAALFVVSPIAANMPFKGGTLVPSPMGLVPLQVDIAGELALTVRVPLGLPPGSPFYMQYWIQDPGAPQGFSASNGLQATVP